MKRLLEYISPFSSSRPIWQPEVVHVLLLLMQRELGARARRSAGRGARPDARAATTCEQNERPGRFGRAGRDRAGGGRPPGAGGARRLQLRTRDVRVPHVLFASRHTRQLNQALVLHIERRLEEINAQ